MAFFDGKDVLWMNIPAESKLPSKRVNSENGGLTSSRIFLGRQFFIKMQLEVSDLPCSVNVPLTLVARTRGHGHLCEKFSSRFASHLRLSRCM